MKKKLLSAAIIAFVITGNLFAYSWNDLKNEAKKELDKKRGVTTEQSEDTSSSKSSSGSNTSSSKATATPAEAVDTSPNSEDDFDFIANDDFTEVMITKYHGYRKNVVIPATIQDIPVTAIGRRAFYYKDITSVVIPDGCTKLGEEIFANSEKIESVTFPKGLKYIPANSFRYCSRLKHIDIPDSVVTIGIYAFADSNLKREDLKLPSSLIWIDRYAFKRLEGMFNNPLPSGIKYIGRENYLRADIPEGVEIIESGSFSVEESINLPKSLKWIEEKAIKIAKCKSVTLADGFDGKYYSYHKDYDKHDVLWSSDEDKDLGYIIETYLDKDLKMQKYFKGTKIKGIGDKGYEPYYKDLDKIKDKAFAFKKDLVFMVDGKNYDFFPKHNDDYYRFFGRDS